MVELILCGRGGQGVVFLTRVLGQIAAAKGLNVISSETHGMAVRGGSINSHLRIGRFYSPLVRRGHADFLLSLDHGETANNRHFLRIDGLIVENSAQEDEPGIRRIDATRIARDIGRIQLENVVLAGFASRINGFPVSGEELRAFLAADPRPAVREMNLKALEAGLSWE
ncbi:MAG: 2-oxoacid:acceptor oxidoreductase family protein [Desulfomonile sp.]|nr:2-oxoacid:acceptor oxidoreductase family protein [Desulfomonile sp.]